ncbi:MAG: hypothetical protein DWQ06_13775 [Calditrichaeota bacterium]|nr:MAG: hypothetical protein DWQ06_13775 [Calditrichota bacterium]
MNKNQKSTEQPKRQGKDDMNLVEFPFASIRPDNDKKFATFSREEKDPNGNTIQKEWTIEGHIKLGLPIPSTEDTLLAIIELCKEQSNFKSKTVYFNRAELLNRMNYGKSQRYYKRLEKDLQILKAVSIEYKNSFWHNQQKQLLSRGVGIVQEYQIYNEKGRKAEQAPLFKSFIMFTDSYFESLQDQYIKNLDSEFYFSLTFHIAKKLYRILDKRFYNQPSFFFDLRELAENFLGLTQNQATKEIKKTVTKASEELVRRGFLERYDYRKIKTGKYQIWFYKAKKKPLQLPKEKTVTSIPDIFKILLDKNVSQRCVNNLIKNKEKALADFVIEKYDFTKLSIEDYVSERIKIFDLIKELGAEGKMKKIENDGAYLWNLICNDEIPESYQRQIEEKRQIEENRKREQTKRQQEELESKKSEEVELQQREEFFKEFDKLSDDIKLELLEIAKKEHQTKKYEKLKLEPQEIKEFLEERRTFYFTFSRVFKEKFSQ